MQNIDQEVEIVACSLYLKGDNRCPRLHEVGDLTPL